MDFDKKYWSSGEYLTDENNTFNGFVGIKDGEAYEFATGKILTKNGTYSGAINAQNENYDRILSQELKLPYTKEDVTFAINDFLQPNIIKSNIKRLQDNNDYIFRNSIISNSVIPYTDNCILLSALKDKPGKLYKYDFNTSAYKTETYLDSTFYPTTIESKKYYVYNKLGAKVEKLDKDTRFVKTNKKIEQYSYDNLKEAWGELNNIDLDTINDSAGYVSEADVENLRYDKTFNGENKIEKNDGTSGTLLGDCDFIQSSSLSFTTKIESDLLKNICSAVDINGSNIYNNSAIAFNLKELELLIKGNVPSELKLNDKIKSDEGGPKIFNIDNTYKHVLYEFKSNEIVNIRDYNTQDNVFNITFTFTDTNATLCAFPGSDKVKAIIRYTVGTLSNDLINYETIPAIERKEQYSYVWAEKEFSDEDNKNKWHHAEPNITYKFLTESVEWLSATKPVLIMQKWSFNSTNPYTPADNMTASDVYNFMLNRPDDYYFPKLYRNEVKYENKGSQTNPRFKEKIYSITSYAVEVDENNNFKVNQDYKKPEDLFAYLKTADGKNYIFSETANKYNKVPDLVEERFITTDINNVPSHNFNEIIASEIITRDFDEKTKSCNLIIFLLFKTKVLIFKTKYFYANGQNTVTNTGDLTNDDFYIDLNDNKNYIELTNIDPEDETSLKFLNLNSIKVYKNMMYLVDSKLDMLSRYSIDYLIDKNENLENSFNIKSLKLIDVLQGSGDSVDKIYFNGPCSIDVCDDKLYIVDRGNKCVKSYTSALNYRKTIKNGFFSQHDIQAVAINPFACRINEIDIKANSLWIASVLGTRMFISVLEDDIVKVYGQIEDISLLENEYSWLEEIRGIHFSKAHSNYFYLSTTKRVYKFHVSQPFYPFASLSYFKQRSLISTMRWAAMQRPWHKIPAIYNTTTLDSLDEIESELTWDYIIPSSSAEVLDNKCFCLTGDNRIEGDIIFHFGILYDESKVQDYIKRNKLKFNNKMTFYDIESGILATMIKSSAMLFYNEPASFISSLTNIHVKPYDIYRIEDHLSEDYINTLTVNKLLYSISYNLLLIKNSLIGHFRAATNLDNVIVYDNLVMDDYFNKLQIGAEEDYFAHENEHLSIIVNRALENIHDLQEKILQKMQTEFMAAQSYVNNTSRII